MQFLNEHILLSCESAAWLLNMLQPPFGVCGDCRLPHSDGFGKDGLDDSSVEQGAEKHRGRKFICGAE